MNAKRMNPIPAPRRRAAWTLMAAAIFVVSSAVAQPCGIDVGAGETLIVSSNETHKCIKVAATGTLKINGAKLTLTGPGSSTVDGVVQLLVSSSRLAFTTRDHTVSGSGKIIGQHDGAEILCDGVTLTNAVNIEGHMVIKDGTIGGTFQNEGAVNANVPGGTLDMAVTTIDDTAGSCRWKVETSSSAKLLFSVEPAALEGDFCVTNGILQAGIDTIGGDDIDVDSTGCLTHTGGSIFAGINDSFSFCPAVR